MHPYELAIITFMQTVATDSVSVDALFAPSMKDINHFLQKMYEDDPKRPFTLRLSSVGRPLCQSQMHKNGIESMDMEWNTPLRMFFGGVLEASTIAIMKAAGLNIQEEQKYVKLKVMIPSDPPLRSMKTIEIPGSLDIVLDDKVWDIKSASPYSFENKFESYETLKQDDSFGYLPQLYGYAKARGLPPGGFIVIDKSSGVIKIIPVPDNYEADMEAALLTIAHNVKILLNNEPFQRQYADVDEKFKKKLTGNKVLGSPCMFCNWKYKCWDGLKHLPVQDSTAFDRPYKYYTVLGEKTLDENIVSESQGQTPTEDNSSKDISRFLRSG